jgi:hypothetical protein
LLLAWLNAEVLRSKSPVINLGSSFSEFVVQLGYQRQGGKRGDMTRIKNQAMRLFSSKISLTYGDSRGFSLEQALVAKKAVFFWDANNPGQQSIWNSEVVLSQEFFEALKRSPVPLDWRILRALKQSPMALDLYFWLSHRMYKLETSTRIPWDVLEKQFGSEYGCVRDFKKKVRKHLLKIGAIWIDLCVDATHEDYIELRPSHLLIQPAKPKALSCQKPR